MKGPGGLLDDCGQDYFLSRVALEGLARSGTSSSQSDDELGTEEEDIVRWRKAE